jgi:hypothetical protein
MSFAKIIVGLRRFCLRSDPGIHDRAFFKGISFQQTVVFWRCKKGGYYVIDRFSKYRAGLSCRIGCDMDGGGDCHVVFGSITGSSDHKVV